MGVEKCRTIEKNAFLGQLFFFTHDSAVTQAEARRSNARRTLGMPEIIMPRMNGPPFQVKSTQKPTNHHKLSRKNQSFCRFCSLFHANSNLASGQMPAKNEGKCESVIIVRFCSTKNTQTEHIPNHTARPSSRTKVKKPPTGSACPTFRRCALCACGHD